jgi:hypothetical protein
MRLTHDMVQVGFGFVGLCERRSGRRLAAMAWPEAGWRLAGEGGRLEFKRPAQGVVATGGWPGLQLTAISCLEAKTGKELWKREKVGYFHAGLIRTGDGKLLVLNDSGLLTMLEVDDKGAREVARAKVCGGTLISPARSAGRFYVRDDKEVIRLQLTK